MAAVRIVLADDHAVVRAGLRLVLDAEDDLTVLAEAGDIETAKRMVRAHRPDILVLDPNMPGGESLPLGGVSGRVIRSAACPVLVIPRGQERPLAALTAAAAAGAHR